MKESDSERKTPVALLTSAISERRLSLRATFVGAGVRDGSGADLFSLNIYIFTCFKNIQGCMMQV